MSFIRKIFFCIYLLTPHFICGQVLSPEKIDDDTEIRNFLLNKYADIKIRYAHVDGFKDIGFTVMVNGDDSKILIYTVGLDPEIRPNWKERGKKVGVNNGDKLFKPETVLIHGYVLTPEGRQKDMNNVREKNIAYWIKRPQEGTLEIDFLFKKKQETIFTITISNTGIENIRMKKRGHK